MKRFVHFSLFLMVLWLSSPCAAQTITPPVPQPSSEQSASHQMNQPPPETGDKYSMSPEIVDEIMELYRLAKQKHEAQKEGTAKAAKDQTQKPATPGKDKR